MSRTLVYANEVTAAKRRVYFDVRLATDGMTPDATQAGGQPQISTNGAAWTNAGIGVLVAIGAGRYYADLTQAAVLNAGALIETRFKASATAETPGDSVQVIGFDPAAVNLRADLRQIDGAALTDAILTLRKVSLYNNTGDAALSIVADVPGGSAVYIEGSGIAAKAVTTANTDATTPATAVVGGAPEVNGVGLADYVAAAVDVPDLASLEATVGEMAETIEDRLDATVSSRSTLVAEDVAPANVYFADIQFIRDQSSPAKDEYLVQWIRNGVPLTTGITAARLQVVRRADGADLVAATDLAPIGATGAWKLDVTGSQRQVLGEGVLAVATATIDGQTRTWRRALGRDR